MNVIKVCRIISVPRRDHILHVCCPTVPMISPPRGGDVTVYVWHKPSELAHTFLFCSCVYVCLHGTFNCISFHKLPRQLYVFWLCSSGLVSALLVLSTVCLFMKVSFSPDIIPCGDWALNTNELTNCWLTWKHSRLSEVCSSLPDFFQIWLDFS